MRETVPISVGIPTWARGARVLGTIERLLACDPRPEEVIVHVDAGDGTLESALAARFPEVRLLVSASRVGPGGGRHRCLVAATQPIFVSFDDDSWPLDGDFFAETLRLFAATPDVALFAATIVHPGEVPPARVDLVKPAVEFTGCGWAISRTAYRQCAGFVDRPLAYGIEESDLGLQLFARGLKVARTRSLRVFHDTQLAHHRRPEQATASIQNVALLAWLRFPVALWPRAVLQVLNMAVDQARRGRGRGVPAGIVSLPRVLWQWRRERRPLPASAVRGYLARRQRPAARLSADCLHEPVSVAH
jgi:GT2 family glycosyltransferase